MELATLFTHGHYVIHRRGPSAPANWRAILDHTLFVPMVVANQGIWQSTLSGVQ
jgi:hypothetical protein